MKYAVATIVALLLCLLPRVGEAQQYTGTSGLIHVPSAEMHPEGSAFIGAHWIDKHMMPDVGFRDVAGEKYSTYDYYLALAPFKWIEFSFVNTERLDYNTGHLSDYTHKDRSASLKIRPLAEGKYYPAIAIGCNDLGTSAFKKASQQDSVQLYFMNAYIAATKHFNFSAGEVGVTLAYRRFLRDYNAKWNGLVGGVTFRPAFFPQARAIVEYTGNEFLLGVDALLWNFLRLQASLKDFQYPNFGLALQFNLL